MCSSQSNVDIRSGLLLRNVFASFNPGIHGQFKYNEYACECHNANYFTEQISHVQVPLCSMKLERFLSPLFKAYTAFRFGRPQEATHDAVVVRYRCRQCGFRFSATYGFFVEGKVFEYGEYTIKLRDKQISTEERQFCFIQSVFDQMKSAGSYSWTDYNCKHWARDFFAILVDKVLAPSTID